MFNLLIFLAFLGREQPPPRGCVLKPIIVQGLITFFCSRLRAAVCSALSTEQYNRTQAEKQREDEIKKINSNFKYEIK